ncbi:hypothetical protein NL54_00720 [Pantoea stewartii]|nr:hypothetical protein NL54_00720 [Pantoea stewartii]KHN62160.1 hypothetical protein OI73_15095 [Pantoea stewartii]
MTADKISTQRRKVTCWPQPVRHSNPAAGEKVVSERKNISFNACQHLHAIFMLIVREYTAIAQTTDKRLTAPLSLRDTWSESDSAASASTINLAKPNSDML